MQINDKILLSSYSPSGRGAKAWPCIKPQMVEVVKLKPYDDWLATVIAIENIEFAKEINQTNFSIEKGTTFYITKENLASLLDMMKYYANR